MRRFGTLRQAPSGPRGRGQQRRLQALLLAALLVATATGCALGPRVERLGADGYAALNARAATEEARVVMRDGTQVGAWDLVVADGTATWKDASTGSPGSAPLGAVSEIRLRNAHGRGGAIGGTWGFLSGALLGAVVGLAEGGDDREGCGDIINDCMTAGGKAIVYGLATGTLGWAVGAPAGLLWGVDDVYRVPPAGVGVDLTPEQQGARPQPGPTPVGAPSR